MISITKWYRLQRMQILQPFRFILSTLYFRSSKVNAFIIFLNIVYYIPEYCLLYFRILFIIFSNIKYYIFE